MGGNIGGRSGEGPVVEGEVVVMVSLASGLGGISGNLSGEKLIIVNRLFLYEFLTS